MMFGDAKHFFRKTTRIRTMLVVLNLNMVLVMIWEKRQTSSSNHGCTSVTSRHSSNINDDDKSMQGDRGHDTEDVERDGDRCGGG